MKKMKKKLRLSIDTLKKLDANDLEVVAGGVSDVCSKTSLCLMSCQVH